MPMKKIGALKDKTLQGKKVMISSRLKELKGTPTKKEKEKLIGEIKNEIEGIYSLAKEQEKKLIAIDKVINR